MKTTDKILFITLLVLVVNCPVINAQAKLENVTRIDTVHSRYTIENCTNTFSTERTIKTDTGYQFWFIDKSFADGKTLKMSVVTPHSSTHAPHVHAEDEMFYILEGNADVYLNGKWKSIPPNTSFYCPSNVEHGIRNSGEKELKYLVIKKYEKN